MYPEICKIGPITIYSYGLLMAAAFLISSALAVQQAKRKGFDPESIFNLSFIAFICGVAGARILYVAENAPYYLKNPLEIFMLQRGGLSWYGGLIIGALCGVIFLKKKKLSIYGILDLIVPFVALGQAIGRVGCLLNGCCYGKVSRFGIYFNIYDSVLIPTQIYSSLALLLIFIILRRLQERPHSRGAVFFTYLVLYSAQRFFIEFLRADNQIIIFGLTLFQLISIAIFLSAGYKLISMRRPGK
ncbi:MAG: prolipoprotein diacylglyceryl transferase [Candidatus Omnitrophota bacterium]|jgi:phosphatidylglycerol:prolipoprotein diacylglycerol transferase